MHIALVTGIDNPDLFEDDLPLKSYLESKGMSAVVVVWNDPMVNWKKFDLIVIRSIWDYIQNIDLFSAWLDYLRSHHIRVFNPVAVLQWNKQKQYLLELAQQGVRIPPTKLLAKGTQLNLLHELDLVSWDKTVVKPTISVGAYKTWIVTKENASLLQSEVNALLREQDVFIQKFAEEIKSHGEISMVYFNKKFSHAVLKKPKEDDFRVQFHYGGTHEKYNPASDILSQANTILNTLQHELLYARIDGYVDKENRFCLMEIELIEPVLFITSDPDAPKNFYTALLEIISG